MALYPPAGHPVAPPSLAGDLPPDPRRRPTSTPSTSYVHTPLSNTHSPICTQLRITWHDRVYINLPGPHHGYVSPSPPLSPYFLPRELISQAEPSSRWPQEAVQCSGGRESRNWWLAWLLTAFTTGPLQQALQVCSTYCRPNVKFAVLVLGLNDGLYMYVRMVMPSIKLLLESLHTYIHTVYQQPAPWYELGGSYIIQSC